MIVRRAFACIIDHVVIWSLSFAYLTLQPWLRPDARGHYGAGGCVLILPIVALWAAYYAGAESRLGFTFGKYLLDLSVVRVQGGAADFAACLKRHLLDPLDFALFGLPAMLVASHTRQGQRIGDLWAGTTVVKSSERGGTAMPPAARNPSTGDG